MNSAGLLYKDVRKSFECERLPKYGLGVKLVGFGADGFLLQYFGARVKGNKNIEGDRRKQKGIEKDCERQKELWCAWEEVYERHEVIVYKGEN